LGASLRRPPIRPQSRRHEGGTNPGDLPIQFGQGKTGHLAHCVDGHFGQALGNGPQLLGQSIEYTPHVEAKFQGRAEVVSNHKVRVTSGNVFSRVGARIILCKALQLWAPGLSECQHAGMISHHTVDEAFPVSA
jgi:hypothetical protein